MELYIGVYSDEILIEHLKKKDEVRYGSLSDEQWNDIFKKGVDGAVAHFYAKDINKAKKMAKHHGLKNFSQVCNKLYEKGKDYAINKKVSSKV